MPRTPRREAFESFADLLTDIAGRQSQQVILILIDSTPKLTRDQAAKLLAVLRSGTGSK